ncbi:MAG: hypothetical protein RL077_5217, partial [Verrucomicrobiota bacterium]
GLGGGGQALRHWSSYEVGWAYLRGRYSVRRETARKSFAEKSRVQAEIAVGGWTKLFSTNYFGG